MNDRRGLRYGAIGAGVLLLGLAVAYGLNLSWATATWPWPDGPFSHLFEGSILAAVAASLLWMGLSAEWGAAAGGALGVAVMCAGMAGYLLTLILGGRDGLWLHAVWFAGVAAAALILFVWSRRFALRDRRGMPSPVRGSFVVFAAVLLLAATALILRVATIFPWPLNPDSSVMFGCIFLGNAVYFLYGLARPAWHNARGQLLSFLAYDLFLIPAFFGLFTTVPPDRLLSLVIYQAVLLYSAGLAVFYLFVHRATRTWAVQEPAAAPAAS